MKIYNTLTKKIEEIKPINPPSLGFYACGFTVYDYAHLGHLRRYTMDDILLRTLQHAGFLTNFVQNVTDVGHLASDADTGQDKMEKGAKKYQTSVEQLARQFEDYFYQSMAKMGNLQPDVICRASEHIEEQLLLVKRLVEAGYGYEIEGDGIYFDTSRLDDYGKLARLSEVELQEGARVEKVMGKRNPSDFALWKFERPGENRAMSWPSPWAEKSFPGWHIECTAMSIEYLGEQFEIHTGGIDHIPVHHTNEIAQAEAATGLKPFVKYWVHHNHLLIQGEKMSKSLGNFFTIDDVKERGFHPRALRLLFLGAHYRSEMNFTWENLAGAQRSYEKLLGLMSDLKTEPSEQSLTESEEKQLNNYRNNFYSDLEEDLKTPEAMSTFWAVTKSQLPAQAKRELLLEFDQILNLGLEQADKLIESLGLKPVTINQLPAEIQALLQERHQARLVEDWQRADQLRQELEARGYQIEDLPGGKIKVFQES